jgi:3-oxoadipate enol-lactonase
MRPHAKIDGPPEAPAIVFANSLGSRLELWDAQAAALAGSWRVVRYDHRGHGGTPVVPGPFEVADLARDVLEIADGLGLERFSFVGLSMGGAVGQWLGANAPDRLDGLVLACTSARFGTPELWRERAATVRAEGMEAVADAVMARWFTPAADPELVAHYRAMLCATPAEGYAACCEALAAWDFRRDLPRIAVPTLAIAGDVDPSTPPGELDAIVAAVPDARLVTLHAAHLANVEQPAAFTRAVVTHLEAREAA